MIKGIQKKVFIIKDTGSEIFEEAIFVVRAKTPELSNHTMKREAGRILEEKTSYYQKENIKKRKAFLKFFNEN